MIGATGANNSFLLPLERYFAVANSAMHRITNAFSYVLLMIQADNLLIMYTLLAIFRRKIAQTDAATVYILAAVFVLLIMTGGIIELSDDVMEGDTEQLDLLILQYLRQEGDLHTPIGPAWLLQAARDITALGGHTVLTLVTFIAAGYCAIIRRYRAIVFILAASAGGIWINHGLKEFFGRARPDVVPHLVEVSTLSFPSGHAMLSAAIYLSLAAIISQILPRHRQKIYIISMALLLTALVGFSRIYLGVHYPSDVLAGWIIGTAWAIFCWLVMRVGFIRKGNFPH